MDHRVFRSYLLVIAVAPLAVGQAPPAPVQKTIAVKKSPVGKTWTPPRTPDGQPDLQGIWTNPTITPFERPNEFAGKPILTEKEAAELEERAAKSRVDAPPKE